MQKRLGWLIWKKHFSDLRFLSHKTSQSPDDEYQSRGTTFSANSVTSDQTINVLKSSALQENTNLMGRITVWLTCCLFCLDSAALLMLN